MATQNGSIRVTRRRRQNGKVKQRPHTQAPTKGK